MDAAIAAEISGIGAETLDAIEVSGTGSARYPWRNFQTLSFPEFDLVNPSGEMPSADVVICEQVLEHVTDPWKAAQTLYRLTRPGGRAIVSTPFLLRIHGAPGDYWRFTPDGLVRVLEGAGLTVERVHAWGNRTAVLTNLFGWTPAFRALPKGNRREVPVVVWAFARRPNP